MSGRRVIGEKLVFKKELWFLFFSKHRGALAKIEQKFNFLDSGTWKQVSLLSKEGADGFDQQVTNQPVAWPIRQVVAQLMFAMAG